MKSRIRTCGLALLIGAVTSSACGHTDPDCVIDGDACNAFQPGTDMSSADFGVDESVEGQLQAYAQSTGNLAVVAGAALTNVTAACRNIAIDLGDDPTGGTGTTTGGAHGKTGTDLMNFWCTEAAQNMRAVFVASNDDTTLSITPPICTASVQEQSRCQNNCNASGSCGSSTPTCDGGTIDISCSGNCTGSAGSKIDCVGACSGQCGGACIGSVASPVDCNGKCDGTCAVKSGTSEGLDADGTCHGTCTGTCSLDANETVNCDGLCNGQCDATCGGVSQAPGPIICSGNCSGASSPVSCMNGVLGGGCAADSDCRASCNAVAQAAEICTPAVATLSSSSTFPPTAGFANLSATVAKNFPALLLVIQGQGVAMANIMQSEVHGADSLVSSDTTTPSTNGETLLGVAGVVCIADMVAANASSNLNFADALSAANKVSVVIGGPTSD